ncbi:MAG: class I SAM-dependent methyltransferase [Eubacterium sp.]|nr:class I SAM-dependent methyltransferase [Eubacterium sp.]
MNLKKIPFHDNSIDAAVCLNVLEHIENDKRALKEIFRVMKGGGIVCFVVPYGKNLYDYYDESIFHKRRYGKKELAKKVCSAGFKVTYENYIGTVIYPAFAIKKHWNQLHGRRMSNEEKRRAFTKDQDTAKDSRLGHLLMGMEYLLAEKMHFPFGIRNVVLAEKR